MFHGVSYYFLVAVWHLPVVLKIPALQSGLEVKFQASTWEFGYWY